MVSWSSVCSLCHYVPHVYPSHRGTDSTFSGQNKQIHKFLNYRVRWFASAVESVRSRKPASNFTTCLPVTWGLGNPIFRSKQADLQELEFHFSMFCTDCRIGQESLTGLKEGAKCSSTSSSHNWISSVQIRALFLALLCVQHGLSDHFLDMYPHPGKIDLEYRKIAQFVG